VPSQPRSIWGSAEPRAVCEAKKRPKLAARSPFWVGLCLTPSPSEHPALYLAPVRSEPHCPSSLYPGGWLISRARGFREYFVSSVRLPTSKVVLLLPPSPNGRPLRISKLGRPGQGFYLAWHQSLFGRSIPNPELSRSPSRYWDIAATGCPCARQEVVDQAWNSQGASHEPGHSARPGTGSMLLRSGLCFVTGVSHRYEVVQGLALATQERFHRGPPGRWRWS
jgi:hypothetical protein